MRWSFFFFSFFGWGYNCFWEIVQKFGCEVDLYSRWILFSLSTYFFFWECFFFPWDLLFLKGYLCCICLVLLLSWKTSLFSTKLNKIFTGLLINLVWIGRGILIIGIGDKKWYLDDQFKQLQKLLQNENNSDFVVDFYFLWWFWEALEKYF